MFLFNVTAISEIYTYGHPLSLHDALPIWPLLTLGGQGERHPRGGFQRCLLDQLLVDAEAEPERHPDTTVDAAVGPVDHAAVDELGRSVAQQSELQSLMRSSYAVFCFEQKHQPATVHAYHHTTRTIL